MTKLLTSFQTPKDQKIIMVRNPLRYAIISNMFLYRYIASYRLHAVKAIMKTFATNVSQPIQLNLDYCPPFRFLPEKHQSKPYRLYEYPWFRDPEICAKDLRTFWVQVSKPNYRSSLFQVICD